MSKLEGIDLLGSNRTTDIAEQVRTAGTKLTKGEDGEFSVSMKFPGTSETPFSRGDLDRLFDILIDFKEFPQGDSPVDAFERTMVEEPDGSLSAQFSEAPRSRRVSMTKRDRRKVAALIDEVRTKWDVLLASLESDTDSE